MKKKPIAVICICSLIVIAGACLVQLSHRASAGDRNASNLATVVQLVPRSIQLGTIDSGSVAIKTISLKNNSGNILKIQRIIPSCGCTTVNAVHEISPHGQATLRVRYDTFKRTGEINKMISVWFSGYASHLEIPIQGFSSPVYIAPMSLFPKDALLGQKSTVKFEVRRIDNKMIKNPRLICKNLQEHSFKQTAGGIVISGSADNMMPGEVAAEARLECDNAPALVVPITYRVRGNYVSTPAMLNFGGVSDGKAVTRELRVSTLYPVDRVRIGFCPRSVKINLKRVSNKMISVVAVLDPKNLENNLLDSKVILYYGPNFREPVVIPAYAAVL
ncbi:MAG: DUF1573 domain-containing protein [Capsulimonas sp.]|uniref:DUF1573 domain-containing protein n=1 Tax=Capsulimonas sp. TaxID=2494211 RepID=UPI003266E031